jgi:hypothetical protein
MSDWEMKIIAEEAERLIRISAQNAELRAQLRVLAERILRVTETPLSDTSTNDLANAKPVDGPEPPIQPREPENGSAIATVGPVSTGGRVSQRDSRREPLRELTLGRRPAAPIASPVTATFPDESNDELRQIEERCRAKSDAVRWQAESHRRIWEGVEAPVDDAPVDPAMTEWSGHLVDCFYWLDDQDSSQATDLSLLDDVGGCFEALAEAIRLVPTGEGRRGELERALPMLAEAQSMLRRALQRLKAADDSEQLAVYRIVREGAARHRIFIKRHLRADDLADPAGWPGLLSRIEAVATSGQQSRQQKTRLERMRQHLEVIRQGQATDQDWQALMEIVEEAVGDGIPPSNREIRDLLLPVIDDLPDRDDLLPGFRRVLREMDRFLATRTTSSKVTPGYVPPPEVIQAARLLEGRSVVLIGGIRRREAQASLRKVLGLKDLIWIETKEHQSIEPFEPVIARSDVALVLLAIRWSSHAFGDVRLFCIRHGKPLVRLPGGYGPHQVAVQVLAQASGVLAGS